MRPFRLTTLLMGVALSVLVAPFPVNRVLADSAEPVQLETGDGAPICNSEGIVVEPQSFATSEGRCPAHALEINRTARARAFRTPRCWHRFAPALTERPPLSHAGAFWNHRSRTRLPHASLKVDTLFPTDLGGPGPDDTRGLSHYGHLRA